jgi:2-(1,2-epoxy-1,2-dihydrophenyl)acetyl-CoA isomerase
MSVRAERAGNVTTIVLDRPDVMNALDEEMVIALHRALDEVADARAVVVAGEGRAFSAGRDLSAASPLEEDARSILAELFNPVIAKLRSLPIPTIAAVQGAALGIGFGIAMACDVIIAGERARLGSPFANIGCVLDSGGHAALVTRVGPHRALELIYTSRLLNGAEAAEMGLVNRVVPDDELAAVVQEMAAKIAEGPTAAFAESKAIVHQLVDHHLDTAASMDAEAAAQGRLAGNPDYVEGITAFMEKRSPTFTGR